MVPACLLTAIALEIDLARLLYLMRSRNRIPIALAFQGCSLLLNRHSTSGDLYFYFYLNVRSLRIRSILLLVHHRSQLLWFWYSRLAFIYLLLLNVLFYLLFYFASCRRLLTSVST